MKLRWANKILVAKFLLVAILWLIDFVSKQLFQQGAVINTGISFGLFKNNQMVGLIASICLFLIYLYLKSTKKQIWAYGLILAGGVGNLTDRLFSYGVVDFIHYPIVNVVGNIADLYLVAGFLLFLLVK